MKPIGLVLRQLDSLITERFDRTLARHDISRRQWQLLNTLTPGGATEDSLSDAVGGTVAPQVELLERRGLVRHADGTWELTAAGRDAVAELAADVRAVREQTTAGIDEQTYASTIATLDTMIANLRSAAR